MIVISRLIKAVKVCAWSNGSITIRRSKKPIFIDDVYRLDNVGTIISV